MGAGGRMESFESKKILERVPLNPPFSLSDLKKAIPPHCFKRSLIRSFYYLVQDLIVVYLFYFLANTYIPLLPTPLANVAWLIYWFCQGSVCSGLWLIAHDCGHHAFSEYQWIDDIVGFIIHSAFLTPYFSWKYTHRGHHSHSNSLDHNDFNIPNRKSKIGMISKLLNNPLGRVFILVMGFTVGFPIYLLTNVTGKKYDRFTNHFDPCSPIFTKNERIQVVLSDIGLLAALYAIKLLLETKGAIWVTCMYLLPVLSANGFVVLVSYLHHTHRILPHYDSTEWNWIRGSLSTVDRDFGIMNTVFHDIPHTHVLHHLFPYISHYHAKEARDAIKPILGEYYKMDRTPILKAVWREATECNYVEPDEDSKQKGIYWYNKI